MTDLPITDQLNFELWNATAPLWQRIIEQGLDQYRIEMIGPSQMQVIGDVAGLRVLDVGCGSGYLTRLLRDGGAEVQGIDFSPTMIELANAQEAGRADPIRYQCIDARRMADHFEHHSFDLLTGCMSFMDITDPAPALVAAAILLKPEGRIVISITHPVTNAPVRYWQTNTEGRRTGLLIDRYFEEQGFIAQWGAKRYGQAIKVVQYHRTLDHWSRLIAGAGLLIARLHEPRPSAEAVARLAELDDCNRVPYILIFDLIIDPRK